MDLDDKLSSLIKRRGSLETEVQRLQGRKEQAEKNLAQIEEECRSKKIDPSKIDEVIAELERLYVSQVEELETDIKNAEQALSAYTGDSR
jgi:chromosome segregation ATPase